MMLNIRSVFCFLVSLALLSGCSKSETGSGQVSSVSFSLPAGFGGNSSLGTACFAVNIVANDIQQFSPGSCDSTYGLVGGLVPLGASIELEAPRGQARTIEIYYVESQNGCSTLVPSVGMGTAYGSNNIYRIGSVQNIDFDQPEVEVIINIEYPSNANSLATLVSSPSSCRQNSTVQLAKVSQARVVNGAYNGQTQSGNYRVHIRVHDKKFDLQNPTAFTGQIKPVRLGEE